jgi:cbb3-type cytochrome oxidase maturation protein
VLPLAISLHWILFSLASLMGIAAWLIYLWAVRDGQFKDVESAAQRMLEVEIGEGRPGPQPSGSPPS